MHSFFLIDIGTFNLTTSTLVHFGSSYHSISCPFYLSCQVTWHIVHKIIDLLMPVKLVVTSSFSFMILVICVFSFFHN